MDMETIITIATVVIALSSIVNVLLAYFYSQQTSDLYQAIVISTILSDPNATEGSSHLGNKIGSFKKHYKGKTPVFD